METLPSVTKERAPSSRVLEELLDRAPADDFSLGWLMAALHERSFGIVMLFLGLVATVPLGSSVPGLMLAVLAAQMIVGRGEPAFPHFIADRRLPTRHLLRLGRRGVPLLLHLEKVVHPRWPVTFDAMKHAVGIMVFLLTGVLLLTPVPLSNVLPAITIALISLAYVEEDGLLLSISFFVALILILATSAAVWGTIVGATFLSHVW